MKKLISTVTILIAGFIFSITGNAQIAGNALAEQGTLGRGSNYGSGNSAVDLKINQYSSNFSNLLEANVMINVKAVSYVAIFSLTQYGKTIEEVETAMGARSAIFKNSLEKEGLNSSHIFFDPITMIPTYETEVTEKKLSRTFNEVPSGYEMKRNIHITFTSQDQINPIITIAAKAEVYDLVKVEYNIENKDAILAMLRQEALKIMLDKKLVLEKAGIYTKFSQVGEMQSSAYPFERYAQYYAYRSGAAPNYITNNSRKGQAVQVSYNYAEKNKTIYYDKVSDKQFDKVINPVVGEPMVQIYLSLKGQYQIIDPVADAATLEYNAKMQALRLRSMELDNEAKKKDIELKRTPVPVMKAINPVKQ